MKDEHDNSTTDLITLHESQQQMAQINEQYGDNLPYSYDRVVNECAFFIEASATAAIELGKRLILIKEMEQHGQVGKALEQLGISWPTANRVMKAVLKLPNSSTSTNLVNKLQSKSKLFELMTLDTDDLEELAEGGTVAGLTLDDVDKMTVRELKVALREARMEGEAKDKRMAEKSAKNDELNISLDKLSRKLTEKQGLLAQSTPEQETQRLRAEVENLVTAVQIDYLTRDIPEAFRHLLAHSERTGTAHDDHMRGWLTALERQIGMVRDEFQIYAGAGEDEATYWQDPEVQRQAEEAVAELDIPTWMMEPKTHNPDAESEDEQTT